MGMARVDRNAVHNPQEWTQEWLAIKFLVDDVTNWTRAGELQHDCVHPCDVVGQKQKSAAGQVSQPVRRDPVKAAKHWPRNNMERALNGGHGGHCLSFTINAWPSAIGNLRWKAA